jgi:hypothetical protein
MPGRRIAREFLRVEAGLLGRAPPGPAEPGPLPADVRDRRIRALAARGEPAAAIARALTIDVKTVLRCLGQLRPGRRTR